MCLIVMWQWAHGASAARESVYFHKSQRSINTEGRVWGWPFSCQVCGVLKTAPILRCSATRQGIPFHPTRIHPISCQQGPLSSETGWKRKKKTTEITVTWSWQTNLFLQTGKEEKWSLCCKNKSSELRLRNLPRHVISPRDFYLQSHPQSLHIISLGAE